MAKYTLTTTDPYKRTIQYLCDHPDSQPGDVEPCAGTDTDGEWIEVKKKNQASYAMLLINNIRNFYSRVH